MYLKTDTWRAYTRCPEFDARKSSVAKKTVDEKIWRDRGTLDGVYAKYCQSGLNELDKLKNSGHKGRPVFRFAHKQVLARW